MRLKSAFLLFLTSASLFALESEGLQKDRNTNEPIMTLHSRVQNTTKSMQGQTIYEQHCIVCHRDGLAGAPKVQDEKDWKPHLAGKTIDDLVGSSIKGINAMPPKGTCSECNDADLKAAIQYMLPHYE